MKLVLSRSRSRTQRSSPRRLRKEQQPAPRRRCDSMGGIPDRVTGLDLLLAVRSEAQEWHVVEVGLADAVHLWRGYFDDEHFGEELNGGAEQVAGVADGAVFLEADRDVDVWGDLVVDGVEGEGATAERFDVGQVDLGPHWGVGVVEFVAGTDDLDLAEAGDEARDVALAHPVLLAELGQGGEEVVAVVEGDGEAAAEGQFVATHGRLPAGWWLGG